jgi:hypothetical protein
MEKTDGDGRKVKISRGRAKKGEWTISSLPNLIRFPAPLAMIDGIIVLPLSRSLSILLPPLFVSSLPKRAIGFSFPRGTEGKLLGVSLIGATVAISVLLSTAFGFIFGLAIIWIMGGTGVVILYNSTRRGLAFVKEMCSACRLLPIIEEHEIMHLRGEPSEEVVWREAKKKYTYEGLGLGTDPKIHSFCPIAKRLKENP